MANANARLIAAAPELLAMLSDVTDWLEGLAIDARHVDRFSVDSFALVKKARAAIAKAKGDAE